MVSNRGPIVVAMDSFKGSLSSKQACSAVAKGIKAAIGKETRVTQAPMSDGGEGFANVLQDLNHANNEAKVCDSASVIGFALQDLSTHNIMRASSKPIESMLRTLARSQPRSITIGLGGTRTMDGGLGFLSACGLRAFTAHDVEIDVEQAGVCKALGQIHRVTFEPAPWIISAVESGTKFIAACDVSNQLLGEHGAARTFGPQKGATHSQIQAIEQGLERLTTAMIHANAAQPESFSAAGAGAAGGLGFALAAALHATLKSGFDIVARAYDLDSVIADASLVITGEGKLDYQTQRGKVAQGVARIAAAHDVPCIAIAGQLAAGAEDMLKTNGCRAGFDNMYESSNGAGPVEAMSQAAQLLENAAHKAITRS